MRFYTSDTHFDHANIIKYSHRPFKNVDEMNEMIIRNWNSLVGKYDEVFHLGDFCFSDNKAEYIASRLNGKIHLIWGNHDSKFVKNLARWETSSPYMEIRENSLSVTLFHYKCAVWNKSHHGAIQLFGHDHGSNFDNTQQCDVGVDCWDYRPVTFTEIRKRLENSPRYQGKHHGK